MALQSRATVISQKLPAWESLAEFKKPELNPRKRFDRSAPFFQAFQIRPHCAEAIHGAASPPPTAHLVPMQLTELINGEPIDGPLPVKTG